MAVHARPNLDLLLLTCAAGAMDALSYLRSGVFTANMTGNTVVLGLTLAGFDRERLPGCVTAIVAFAIGALVGATILVRTVRDGNARGEIRIGLLMELPLAIVFAALSCVWPDPAHGWRKELLIGVAACALGIQSAAVRRLRISGVVTTFITGTITTAMVSLASRSSAGSAEERSSPVLLGGMFVCYAAGAGVAAGLTAHHPALAVFTPGTILAVVLLRAL